MKAKRIFSLLFVLLFVCLIASPGYAYTIDSASYDYTVYDMETDEVTYHRIEDPAAITDSDLVSQSVISPPSQDSGVAPAVVIEGSTLNPVTTTTNRPYSYTVRIVSHYGVGSGVVIGECAVLTAAHVVYGKDGYTQSLTITPAQNGTSAPYGTLTVTSADLYVPYAYTSAFPNPVPEGFYPGNDNDWAIIYLDASDDIGNYTGWPTLCSQAGVNLNQSITCVGYSGGTTIMYYSTGTVCGFNSSYAFYGNWSLHGGCSGGPILAHSSGTTWVLYGIALAESWPDANGNGIDDDADQYQYGPAKSYGRTLTGTLWYMCNALGGSQ